ncbi:MAG TPA: hypothetical protein PKM20_10525 [Nitrosomonas sp.]|uniref:hypothetical protein n=1 Tax=Nitrosomonas sp. TaxID=42353 RepID=UPI0020845C4C|nr:hypothetical protein [Nitrosomonas sp.]GJL74405.1 MAG: hypothetical protein NMNS02_05110 [Nitrosomonas sp.]HNP27164.1 hypothetical protein [Nitrosomonas sp.]
MFIKREIIGSIVTLIFYAGTLSTLLLFATGKTTESIRYADIDHGNSGISSADSSSNPYGHEQ